ncbi:MAG: hypothetical protein WBQ89_28725 [Candidatus Acidiferrum sp.]
MEIRELLACLDQHRGSFPERLVGWSMDYLNRKPAIYVGNIIGLVMNLLMVNGILVRAGWTY